MYCRTTTVGSCVLKGLLKVWFATRPWCNEDKLPYDRSSIVRFPGTSCQTKGYIANSPIENVKASNNDDDVLVLVHRLKSKGKVASYRQSTKDKKKWNSISQVCCTQTFMANGIPPQSTWSPSLTTGPTLCINYNKWSQELLKGTWRVTWFSHIKHLEQLRPFATTV